MTERAASTKTGCTEDTLMEAIDELVRQLRVEAAQTAQP